MEQNAQIGSNLVLREAKGSELTHEEMDNNFKILDAKSGKTVNCLNGPIKVNFLSITDEDKQKISNLIEYGPDGLIIGNYSLKIVDFNAGVSGPAIRNESGTIEIYTQLSETGNGNIVVETSPYQDEDTLFFNNETNLLSFEMNDGSAEIRVEFMDNITNAGVIPKIDFVIEELQQVLPS